MIFKIFLEELKDNITIVINDYLTKYPVKTLLHSNQDKASTIEKFVSNNKEEDIHIFMIDLITKIERISDGELKSNLIKVLEKAIDPTMMERIMDSKKFNVKLIINPHYLYLKNEKGEKLKNMKIAINKDLRNGNSIEMKELTKANSNDPEPELPSSYSTI